MEHEDFRSSTALSISNSLIHCIASVGKFEQDHTSVLNLIFEYGNVCGVGEFVKVQFRDLKPWLVDPIVLKISPSP